MKIIISFAGIILIIFGIGTFVYHGYTYTTQQKVAQIGSLKLTADQQKTVYFPPVLGGASIVVGIILVFIGQSRKLKRQ